jgi:SAM-dependent methyltransferase
MGRYREAEEGNRKHWDELAEVHARSYNCEPLLKGGHVLDEVQVREVGDVKGKSLLHLQCHIGTDTLSWARLGARVTGVDISPASLRAARALAGRAGLSGRFIESSLYDLEEKLDEKFDVVYTSVGVLCWLSDLEEWGRLIKGYLKPGGVFYIMESHPFLYVFDDDADELRVRYGYFHEDDPNEWEGDYPDYDDGDYMVQSPSWEWQWSMGDIVNSLIKSGLRLEFLHEHTTMPWKALPCMVQSGEGRWKLPEGIDVLPLMFSIRARG